MKLFDPSRRRMVVGGASVLAAAGLVPLGRAAPAGDATIDQPFANGRRRLATYPEKRPMIVLTSRPPQLETPFEVFNEGPITPNDAFFVRYHHAGLPTRIDAGRHVIRIGGNAVTKPYELPLTELRTAFRPVELIAVNQCSGNGRGLFEPRVTGGQLANGAMGNARWVGVPLKDVLARAQPTAAARQVTFRGLDQALLGAADFVKALDIDHALDGEVMLAYQMNGADIPMLNGYPVKLVVPGYYGTYWVKHVSAIDVIDQVYDGFWMQTAYRIPDNDCACVEPGTKPSRTRPIGRMNVRSFITSLKDGARVRAWETFQVKGIAFDGGQGIAEVAYTTDGGVNWREATLGTDLGKYSFREFNFDFLPAPGTSDLRVRAWNRSGQSQPLDALWQPAGYMRNVVERVRITAA